MPAAPSPRIWRLVGRITSPAAGWSAQAGERGLLGGHGHVHRLRPALASGVLDLDPEVGIFDLAYKAQLAPVDRDELDQHTGYRDRIAVLPGVNRRDDVGRITPHFLVGLLEAASGRYVVVIDGDAQNPVEDVLRIYALLRDGDYEVMKGRRTIRHDGLYRRTISFGYNAIFRLMFRTWGLWDINGKPKAVTRRALEAMCLRSDDWFIDAEIVIQARRLNTGAPYWITLNETDEQKLRDWVRNSSRIQNGTASLNAPGGGAL